MKKLKLILFLFISLLFILPIYSQWYEQILPVGGTMYDMVFFDANTGIISFDSKNVIRTTNGGNNWSIVLQTYVLTLKKVDDSSAFGQGLNTGSNLVIKTTNRGLTWDSTGGTALSVRDFYFVNRDTGWFSAFGGSMGILKTTDGGQTMFGISNGASFGVINFLTKKYNGEYFGWHVNDIGLRLTTNSGINWYKPSTDLDSLNLVSVTFINKDTGWVSGTTNFTYGRIYYTSNGGLNWLKQYEEFINGSPTSINFRTFNKGWGGRDDFKIFATSNGGSTWGFQSIPINGIRKVFMIDTLVGWCGRSKLLHTTNGGGNIVAIKNANGEIPLKYILKQNFPNPFNPTSIIEFTIKDDSKVSLIIYDLMGREIMKLFENRSLHSGTFQSIADFSDKNLSSGIYFYKLIVQGKENIVLTKKMTFVK